MFLIILKIFLAATLIAIGLWMWRHADRWDERGEIPSEWVEGSNLHTVKRMDRGFRSSLIWQRIMAVLTWLFGALIVISIILQLIGVV